MAEFIRYETRARCVNTRRPLGVFGSAYRIVNGRGLPQVSRDLLRDALTWYEQNLAAPSAEGFDDRALFWFRARSTELMSRLWDMIVVLNDERVHVRKIVTYWPGKIVYRDEHQVAALPSEDFKALRV